MSSQTPVDQQNELAIGSSRQGRTSATRNLVVSV